MRVCMCNVDEAETKNKSKSMKISTPSPPKSPVDGKTGKTNKKPNEQIKRTPFGFWFLLPRGGLRVYIYIYSYIL